jgi:ATP-dependent DNA helicase RecG
MKTEDITKLKESQKVEFKSSFDKETIISLAAFANTNGGKVIVGMNDKGKVSGTDILPETEQRYLNAIKNATYPQIMPNIDVVNISGQSVIVFTINEYPVKPVSYKGRYYKRVKNSNHLLSLDEIVNLQLQSLNISYDAYPLHYDFQSLNMNLLEKFIDQVNSMGRIKLNDDLLTNLTKLRLIQNGRPTLASVLLFGNHGYSIHIGRFKSEDTIIDDLLIKDPLMTALDEVMIFIKKHINLSFHFDGSLKRKEKWQYPIDVIRESLLNAVVHRDYKHTTDIVIKIFDNKMVFTNPGILYGNLKLADLERNDYVSSIRNKLLAESFYLIGEIERYGTGFVRIRKKLTGYPNVSYQISEMGDFFNVALQFSPNDSEGSNHGLNEGINEGLNEGLNLDEGLKKLLWFIENNPGKRIPEIEKNLNLPAKTLERWIKIARNNGEIKFEGSKKTGGYYLIKQRKNKCKTKTKLKK